MTKLLQSEKIKSIYCQNLNVHHPNEFSSNRGLIITAFMRVWFWGEELNPDEQEKNIIKISDFNFKEKF